MWVADEEKALAERMTKLADDWEVDTGGHLYDLKGRGTVIPDLVLKREGAEALVEIVWRWRRSGLEQRWELLRKHGPPNMILAVCTAGQDEDLPELPGAVHAFKQVPNARKLWKLAREVAAMSPSLYATDS